MSISTHFCQNCFKQCNFSNSNKLFDIFPTCPTRPTSPPSQTSKAALQCSDSFSFCDLWSHLPYASFYFGSSLTYSIYTFCSGIWHANIINKLPLQLVILFGQEPMLHIKLNCKINYSHLVNHFVRNLVSHGSGYEPWQNTVTANPIPEETLHVHYYYTLHVHYYYTGCSLLQICRLCLYLQLTC